MHVMKQRETFLNGKAVMHVIAIQELEMLDHLLDPSNTR